MKKNKMCRLSSVLLILVLLTTSVVGSTFAKYTTEGTAIDSARVAKWGVSITVDNQGEFFASTYAKDDNASGLTAANSVVAVTNAGGGQDKVVAPGTSGSTTFTIAGTPEVAFKLTADVDATSTVKLEKGKDYTMPAGTFEEAEVKVKPTADYEPITFKIEKQKDATTWETLKIDATGVIADSGTANAEGLTLAELKTALESLSHVYEAGEEVNAAYRITWTWPFETTFTDWTTDTGYTSSYTNADVLDTYLGNEATAQTEAYSIKITATQID